MMQFQAFELKQKRATKRAYILTLMLPIFFELFFIPLKQFQLQMTKNIYDYEKNYVLKM